MNGLLKTLSIWILLLSSTFAQFGQNKVQYKQFDWYYVQTKHFDIYFTSDGTQIAEYSVQIAEEVLAELQDLFNYKINNRLSIIAYNSHNDFQETNTTDAQYGQGTGGFTEPFKNRVVVPFEGSYKKYRHLLRHELVHQVMNDMLYGGTIQNIIAKNITLQLPAWYLEGMAEYLSGGWETYTDMFIRDQIISETLPDINQLSGYLAYRAGQSIMHFVATTYGREKIGEILNNTKGMGSLDAAIKTSLGLNIEELNERWKKALKKEYWPEVATRQAPEDFSKKLTDNKKIGGFYNTSPAISPQGDKIAFISDRDIFLDVYVMNAVDGEVIKKVLESGKANDFEELNVLFPSLSWSPDNKSIAMSAKSGGWDVIYVVDVETEESYSLPIRFDGIESVAWSPDGEKIAFIGANTTQSDVYIYDLKTKDLINATSDIFSETDPSWSPDSKKVFFSSDRGKFLTPKIITDDFNISDNEYNQIDVYYADLDTKEVVRVTNWELSDEYSVVVSSDGRNILFVSDKNGIRNIYKKRIVLSEADSVNLIEDIPAYPITNSIGEINQLSLSADGKKLVFTALYNSGYNVYLMNNPFETEDYKNVEPTNYMAEVIKSVYEKPVEMIKKIPEEPAPFVEIPIKVSVDTTEISFAKEGFIKPEIDSAIIFTGQYIASTDTTEKSAEVDYSRYIFGVEEFKVDTTSTRINREQLFKESLDENGNFLVNKYKVSFSPDLIYANAGYSDLYGLLGTTVLLFSDIIGNHRLIGITSLQIDLKNSDYGLAYYNLGNRLNYGFEGFHTARFVYILNSNAVRLYRFRSYGGIASLSYPINRFYRIDGSLSVQNVSSENLDDISVPTSNATYIIPALSFVHDNTIWGYTSPIEGTRFNFTLFGNPGFTNGRQSFYSFIWDYRDYSRFWFDNSFVFRISGGYSGGANPQKFFIGGTEGWINRTFATGEVPLQSASDFAFLTPALPLRGYDYAEKIGSKYSLINLELRMPVIRYLVTGPLPIFLQNILGVVFVDIGSAWNDTSKLKLFTKNDSNETVTNDLLIGTGLGWRVYFIMLWRFDVAWTFNGNSFSQPRYYVSFGLDF
ncbi:MAG: biopolymer transporter Tol [Ignavibacteria bacterium RBG_13_36_8]|nr:MAG: biopolymer transporter Tol [Ignavibacteria bacterium RBG_13_36_8]